MVSVFSPKVFHRAASPVPYYLTLYERHPRVVSREDLGARLSTYKYMLTTFFLWSKERDTRESPARAAFQHVLNWAVCYVEEYRLHVSSEKIALRVFSPSQRAPFTLPGLWRHWRWIAQVKDFKYLDLKNDDSDSWRPVAQHTLVKYTAVSCELCTTSVVPLGVMDSLLCYGSSKALLYPEFYMRCRWWRLQGLNEHLPRILT